MSSVVLGGATPELLISHLAFYGLAAIVADGGVEDLALTWTGGMAPRPQLSAAGLDDGVAADLVLDHARRRCSPDGWIARDVPGAKGTGLMSPRIKPPGDDDAWRALQDARHGVIDALTRERSDLDLVLLGALGEPASWRRNRRGEQLPDEGASRWEMTPRNRGSEFVGARLRKISSAVAARTAEEVRAGLLGERVRDEAGNDAFDSRTATGLGPPGPTDNVLAWCALWGFSQLPLSLRVHGLAHTTGHLERDRDRFFTLPTWTGEWRPARLRSVLVGSALERAARDSLSRSGSGGVETVSARRWLAARGVRSIYTFEIQRFGSASAPERRAQRGRRWAVVP